MVSDEGYAVDVTTLVSIISTAVIPLLTGGATVFKTLKYVQEGELGIKLRFGKAVRNADGTPRVIHPGLRLLIPWVDQLARLRVRQQTIRCNNQEIMLEDRTVFDVSAVVIFRVTDVYRALFEIRDLPNAIEDFCMATLRDVLSARDKTSVAHTAEISADLLEKVREKAVDWGVEFIAFRLTNCSPTSATAQLMLTEMSATTRAQSVLVAFQVLGGNYVDHPGLAAALIGVPVATSIGSSYADLPNPTRVVVTSHDHEEDHEPED